MGLKKKLSVAAFIAFASSGAFAVANCVSGPNTNSCIVPVGITSMNISIIGGGGGTGGAYFAGGGIGGAGGSGASCTLTALPVTAGQLLTISVGPQGAYGLNGTGIQPTGTDGGFGSLSSVVYGGTTYSAAGGLGGGAGTSTGNGPNGVGGQANANTCVGGVSAAGAAGLGGSGAVVLSFSTAAIPTLGEWGVIFMASLMAMFGIRRMRRSQ